MYSCCCSRHVIVWPISSLLIFPQSNQLPAYISAIQSAPCLYYRHPISPLLIFPQSNQLPAYITAIQSAPCLYYCHPISYLFILLPSNQLSVYISAIQLENIFNSCFCPFQKRSQHRSGRAVGLKTYISITITGHILS